MLENNLKALTVVLAVALAVFFVAKPICLHFMSEAAFKKRRNVWVLLTVTAFVSPSFWYFAAVAVVLVGWLARDEPNPMALFLFMAFVIPPARWGISSGSQGFLDGLFDNMNLHRLLAVVILLPWIFKYVRSGARNISPGLRVVDGLVLLFGLIQIASRAPYEPFTRTIVHGFFYSLDVLAIYFVVSRSCSRKALIVEAMACLCMACAILAPLAVFEVVKTWPLYGGVQAQWGSGQSLLMRDGTMRAIVSSGHSLGLGYLMGVAFGVWLFLGRQVGSWRVAAIGVAWLWLGLIAAYSRGPWLMAVLLYFAFVFLGPAGLSRSLKALLIFGAATALVLVSPLGDRILDVLPFVGSVDSSNVDYRVHILEVTWRLVWLNPWFGDAMAVRDLDELLNGQGIVDLVNAYASVALFNGLVGLSVYCAFQIGAIAIAMPHVRRARLAEADTSALGACLIACMIATMFYQATSGPMWLQYVFIGLLVSYASICEQDKRVPQSQRQLKPSDSRLRPVRHT